LDFEAGGAAAVVSVVEVVAVGVVEATAGAEVLVAAGVAMVEVATAGVVEATTGATAAGALTTAAISTPWLKFAARSLKSAAFTRPS
jgi:hypothetical protein